MLSLRHSIGNVSPLESLARNSKSVSHFRCYASPPRTETCAHPDVVILYFRDDFPDNVMQIHGRGFSPYHKIDSNGQLVYIPPAPKDVAPLWETFKKSSMFYRLLANKILESKNYNDFLKIKQELLHTVSNSVSS